RAHRGRGLTGRRDEQDEAGHVATDDGRSSARSTTTTATPATMPTATTAGTTGTTTEAGSPYPARWAAGTARAGFPPRRRRTGRPRAPAAVGTGRSSGPCGAGLPAVRLRRGRPACAAVADHGRTA